MTQRTFETPTPITITSPTIRFPPVHRCIYCGAFSKNLGKEHILPFGLAGDALILPKSSCQTCASITGRIERFFLRNILGPFRVKVGTPTRRPHERPRSLQVAIGITDDPNVEPIALETLDLPVEDYPLIFCGLRLKPPGILTGTIPDNTVNGEFWVRHDKTMIEKFNMTHGKAVRIGTMHPDMFMRAIAKIAYSYAVAKLGYGNFAPLVTAYVLEKSENGCHWVGGDFDIPDAAPLFHNLSVGQFELAARRFVVVSVRLFPFFATPQYHVVVGELQGSQDGRLIN